MSEPRGAGRAGGLLFIAVVLFLGILAVQAVLGLLKWIIGVAVLVLVIGLALKVVDRS